MRRLYKKSDFKRIVNIPESEYRTAFRRDNGRLLHSAVFRRLQRKTQLFPNYESDFFRNRLTHSLEVAQIAKGIAEYLNYADEYFKKNPIDKDLVETASLAHDLGHPPFGHNGEKALDDKMRDFGGFEGNAQTLRILSRLEKKKTKNRQYIPIKNGNDERCGLNLCYRTLASILKYDREIPRNRRSDDKPFKGYYFTEKEIVRKIKSNVLGRNEDRELKSIECNIMDIADDIAYSTYDLEDAFKAEFLSPVGMLSTEPSFIERIAIEVSKELSDTKIDEQEVYKILFDIFGDQSDVLKELIEDLTCGKTKSKEEILALFNYTKSESFDFSNRICTNGYFRLNFSSSLVSRFMRGIEVEKIDDDFPVLSKIRLKPSVKKEVEILKRFTFNSVIESPRLKIAEFRGYDIVKEIFSILENDGRKGFNLLPQDFRELYNGFGDEGLKKRVICDFIAGMTDQYAVEFYARLKSENPQTIFKPF